MPIASEAEPDAAEHRKSIFIGVPSEAQTMGLPDSGCLQRVSDCRFSLSISAERLNFMSEVHLQPAKDLEADAIHLISGPDHRTTDSGL